MTLNHVPQPWRSPSSTSPPELRDKIYAAYAESEGFHISLCGCYPNPAYHTLAVSQSFDPQQYGVVKIPDIIPVADEITRELFTEYLGRAELHATHIHVHMRNFQTTVYDFDDVCDAVQMPGEVLPVTPNYANLDAVLLKFAFPAAGVERKYTFHFHLDKELMMRPGSNLHRYLRRALGDREHAGVLPEHGVEVHWEAGKFDLARFLAEFEEWVVGGEGWIFTMRGRSVGHEGWVEKFRAAVERERIRHEEGRVEAYMGK